MIRIITFILLLIFSVSGKAQTSDFERALIDKSAEVQSIKCDFVEVRTMSVLQNPVKKKGKFSYTRPSNLELNFDDGDFIRMTESRFTMRNAGKTTDMKLSSNPMLKELKRILSACMSGDLKQMTKGFAYNIEEEDGSYSVSLTPQRGRGGMKLKSILMVFDKKDMTLSSLKMNEASGDSIEYLFNNKKIN